MTDLRALTIPKNAGESTREPFVAAGWTFAQRGPDLDHTATHRTTQQTVGPAPTLAALLTMIQEATR